MSEADFLYMNMFCEDFGEHKLFFKNGLADSHPIIGILIMSSSLQEFEKAFMFVRNWPYKMPVSIGFGDFHKILGLLLITYKKLNEFPSHKLLRALFDQCGMKKS
ncbi:unnamed protein product [Rotaria sp. Silwood2]|nr:unnamed protein product [Rotaria sp. Silwood2]